MGMLLLLLYLALLVTILAVTCILLAHLWFRISMTAKNFENFPTYGAANPQLVFWKQYWQSRNFKSDQIPIFSNLLELLSAEAYIFQREGVFLKWFGFTPYIFIYKAEYIKEVINSRVADDKSKDYVAFEPIMGTGLVTSNGKKWRNRRKLIQPCVHMRNLSKLIPIFNEYSLVLVGKLKEKVNEPWIHAEDMIIACAVDIIFRTAMGIRVGAQERFHEISEILVVGEELTKLMIDRLSHPWLWYDTIFYCTSAGRKFQRAENKLRNVVRKVIQEGKEILEAKERHIKLGQYSENKNKIFFEILLEELAKDKNFTYNDIVEESITFIYAGFDTSSSALNWVLCLLGLHSDIQDKVFQELYSIFGDDKTREVTIHDVKNLVYLEQVIKETLRLYPSVPIIGRENKEVIKIGSYVVPRGSRIGILINMLHKNPDMFPNPEKFDPERFSPENSSERDAFSYLPFSCGARTCLGSTFAMIQMKIILAHVLRNFSVTTLDPLDKINIMMTLTLKCLNPPRLRFSSHA
ncbi:cytochrome P450 4V2-like [Stegodyphus dumicola]|uniref:cytochrome P450 4V2-like n=1 Tax=Stegodyphus dumicola TaxID=202533 RepID=UPI0015ABB940|nr:cytochrome P450 4V2-like [Stegodyphus dumicola]